ncbi:metallophosphoesterase, partial [mine drainage metagenome]
PQALILLGDIEAPVPLQELMAPIEALGTQVWFIPGNHDTDHAQSWAALQAWPERNLHGRVVDVAGVRIAGLGGIFTARSGAPTAPGCRSSLRCRRTWITCGCARIPTTGPFDSRARA